MSALATALGLARRVAGVALDAVLPPQCLGCGTSVGAPGTLCAACWDKMVWIAPPLCACCGLPFEFDPGFPGAGEAPLCGGCIRVRPDFDRARAVFRYDEASKGLILGFKHADRLHAAPAFGRWLARAGADLLGEATLVAPVPLHWTRLAWRLFNQAALLAQATARAAGRPCVPDLLLRRRRTPSQGTMGRAARARNVRQAFAVGAQHRERLEGARVVLIDDVLTTGATVSECARVLRRAGAAAVDVLTLARVVRPAAD